MPLQGPFKCNTDLVGQYQGEGASWQLTAWKNCAYFDQRHPDQANPGGIRETHTRNCGGRRERPDASDGHHLADGLGDDRPLGVAEGENNPRQLLGGGQRPITGRVPGDGFSVYDISSDCKNPGLPKSNVEGFAGSFGHSGQWAPDGKTFYITPLRARPEHRGHQRRRPGCSGRHPRAASSPSTSLDGGTPGPQDLPNSTLHDLEFSKDGNTAYITMFGIGADQRFCGAGRQ